MFGNKTYRSETNFVKETIRCPFSGKVLAVTESMFVRYMEYFPEFVERLIHHYNTGLQDDSLILRNSIYDFFEKHVELKNEYFFYILSKYMICFYRCDFGLTHDYPQIFNSLGQYGMLNSLTYAKAPAAFKQYIAELQAMSMLPNGQINLACITAHNCAIVLNRFMNFSPRFGDDYPPCYDDINYIPKPAVGVYHKMSTYFLLKWLMFNVKVLIYHGKLIIIHEQTRTNLLNGSTFISDNLDKYYAEDKLQDLDSILKGKENEKLRIIPEINWAVVDLNPDADEDDIIVNYVLKKPEYYMAKKHPVNQGYPRTATDDLNNQNNDNINNKNNKK